MSDYRAGDRLCETSEATLGQRVPEPLHTRVDQLRDLLHDAGHARPTKARLIGALLLAAEPDANKLMGALAAYDRASVGEALIGKRGNGDVVTLPRRPPGPRPKRRAKA